MPAGAKAYPERLVLDGVPRVHFYEGGPRCPEDVPFPSALRACLEFLDGRLGCKHSSTPHGLLTDCGYAYLMGTSGAAWHLSWGEGWQGDNVALHYMSPDPAAPYAHAFDAAGYHVKWVHRSDCPDVRAAFLDNIKQSLMKGVPVLGFGVVGPPEPAIITGYDEEGNVLIGWSFFQDMPPFNNGLEFEPGGCFRSRDWDGSAEALAILRPGRQPDLPSVHRASLKWALKVIMKPAGYPRRANGLSAYAAWAEALGRSDEFAVASPQMREQMFSAHDDAVGTVAEGRWYGSLYLREVAAAHPAMAESLSAAAGLFQEEHDLMWKVWGEVGGIGRQPEKSGAFLRPDVRKAIIPIILQSRDCCRAAAGHISAALQA